MSKEGFYKGASKRVRNIQKRNLLLQSIEGKLIELLGHRDYILLYEHIPTLFIFYLLKEKKREMFSEEVIEKLEALDRVLHDILQGL